MYADRTDAGRQLARHLSAYAGREDVLVLGLPRGGVVTARAVADELTAPLDVFCVRKLGVPWHPELAMGAVATGGVRVLNDDVVSRLRIAERDLDEVTAAELRELRRRERSYRGDRPAPAISGRVVILVDDGVATGATARAALRAIEALGPKRTVFAAPVGPAGLEQQFADVTVDEIVCPLTPSGFDAVGRWYRDFAATTDDEVRDLLALR